MKKTAIQTTDAPEAIGPYSQAIESEGLLFVSGQVPLDPATSKLVVGGIADQTSQVMKNLEGILRAAGCTFDDVIKTTIYLTDLSHFAEVNAVYGAHFESPPPARATIGVAALPLGAAVEIDAVARTGK